MNFVDCNTQTARRFPVHRVNLEVNDGLENYTFLTHANLSYEANVFGVIQGAILLGFPNVRKKLHQRNLLDRECNLAKSRALRSQAKIESTLWFRRA